MRKGEDIKNLLWARRYVFSPLCFTSLLFSLHFSQLSLSRTVGSVHDFENEKIRTTAFGFQITDAHYQEIRTYSLLRYIEIPAEHTGSDKDIRDYIIRTSNKLYRKFVFVVSQETVLIGAGLAKKIDEFTGTGKIEFGRDGSPLDGISIFPYLVRYIALTHYGLCCGLCSR